MTKLPRRPTFRAGILLAFLVVVPVLFAGTLEPTPFLPPSDAVFTLGDTCVSVVCLTNITVSDFMITSSQIIGNDQVTLTNATLDANAFQNVGGAPGLFINPVTLSGPIDFTFFDRSALNETGTFDAQITGFDFKGTFMGLTGPHTIEAIVDPSQQSLGITTVTEVPQEGFFVTSFFDVFAELSIDGGPFMAGPERHLDLAPEPASIGLALTGCLAVGALIWRRRRHV